MKRERKIVYNRSEDLTRRLEEVKRRVAEKLNKAKSIKPTQVNIQSYENCTKNIEHSDKCEGIKISKNRKRCAKEATEIFKIKKTADDRWRHGHRKGTLQCGRVVPEPWHRYSKGKEDRRNGTRRA